MQRKEPHALGAGMAVEVARSGPGFLRAAAQMKSTGHGLRLVYYITTGGLAKGPGGQAL